MKETYKEDWEEFAKINPLWAIMSQKKEWNDEEFFNAGKEEIKKVIEYLESKNIDIHFDRVLDFGCGVGRLTYPLSEHCSFAYGIDVSETMIKLAKERGVEKCVFTHNKKNDLSVFDDNFFDFIYSNIVLQHIEDKNDIKHYLLEFVRVLKSGKYAYFQLPSTPAYFPVIIYILSIYRVIYYKILKKFFPKFFFIRPYMIMNHIPSREIYKLLQNQANIIEIDNDESIHTKYLIQKL